MKQKFTSFKEIFVSRNIWLYIIISIFQCFWFTEATWYFFWGKFMTYSEIAFYLSLFSLIWILTEIPTGIFADRIGRKVSIIVGLGLTSLAFGLEAGAINKWYLVIGGLMASFGRAFISGSFEALVYDDLKTKGLENIYDRVISFRTQIAYIAYGFGVVIGGFAYLYNFRLPNAMVSATSLIGMILAFMLIENKFLHEKKEFIPLLGQITIGFKELLLPNVRKYIIFFVPIMVLFFLYDWGMSKPAMATNFGFYTKEMGIAYAIMSVANIIVIGFVPFLRKKLTDSLGLVILNIAMGFGYLLAFFKLGVFGLIPLIIIETSGNISEPWISTIVNKEISSEFRATTLSTLQFLAKVPFLLLNFIAGIAIDRLWVNQFHFGLGLAIVLSSVLVYLWQNKNTPHFLNKDKTLRI